MKKVTAYTVISLLVLGLLCSGCFRLTISAQEDKIPKFVKDNFLNVENRNTVEYLTHLEEHEFSDGPLSEHEKFAGMVETSTSMKFKPRVVTKKEQDLEWEIEQIKIEQKNLLKKHSELIKKFNEFMEVHNDTLRS